MERLKIDIQEFTRFAWVSEKARAIWEGRFQLISKSWESIEVRAVEMGVKDACLQSISPDELPGFSERLANVGLVAVPLMQVGTTSTYQNATIPFEQGKPWVYRVLICKPETVAEFVWAWRAKDDWTIGGLLGYPECCRNFYDWSWKEGNWRDVALTQNIGQIAARTLQFPTILRYEGYYQNNVLLRHLGVRMVSHLPCSMTCEASGQMAEDLALVGNKFGFASQIEWTRQILQWPFKWSSLHGIAILITPVVKIVYSTDALSEKVEILRESKVYPAEGGRGDFPFQESVRPMNILGRLNSQINGFSDMTAMLNAHAVILDAVSSLSIPERAVVIDLGCGDGQLLQTIQDLTGMIPIGVESDRRKYDLAEARFVGKTHVIFNEDIFDAGFVWVRPCFLALISITRLHEVSREKALKLLGLMRLSCEHVIFYSYESPEWIGYPGLTVDFTLDAFFTGRNSCASVVHPNPQPKELV